MKIRHRLAAVLTAAAMLLCTGCHAERQSGADSASSSTAPESSSTAESQPDSSAPASEAETTAPDQNLSEPSDLVPNITLDKYSIPENEGMQFVKNLKLGWNLGNTFDAIDMENISAENELAYESAWCGVKTTKETIAAVKAAGFKTIRIPVSWHNHVDENFQISEDWMARVKEVVDWCIESDLYVIVNTHHDNDEKYYYPDSAHLNSSKAYLKPIWTQIANAFADYDEHLILESLNEPRLVGSDYEWWIDPSNAQCQDAIACINQLNQLFVDIVRNSGGQNATRYLLCPGYTASVDGAVNDGFALPKDPANRVIVSVHAYTPYNFALDAAGTKDFSISEELDCKSVTDFMDQLYNKFIVNGTPVLIGEFGARNKDNLEARVEFSAYYVAAARARGITCCWWDNNAFTGSGECFGLLFRKASVFNYPEIVQALAKYCEE